MVAARQKVVILILGTTAALALSRQVRAAAGGPQICYSSSSCTIGEFLYNDEYQPITNASCTLTSKYPDGSPHLTNQLLSVRNDGWYYYNFTTPQTSGYYSAQICCQAGEDYLCLDKSFEVREGEVTPTPMPTLPSVNDIASAVWSYSGRTLTSFGDLISNIWSSSSRTLTSFGDLISGIWNHSRRTLTETEISEKHLLTKEDLEKFTATAGGELKAIREKTNENRVLLEKIVNKPIIENILEEIEDKDLGKKINQSKSLAFQLDVNTQFLVTKTSSLIQKWHSLNEREILDILIEMSEVVGETGESSSYLGSIEQLRQFWGWAVIDDLADQAQAIKTSLSFIQRGISSYGKTNTLLKETKSLLTYVKTAQKILGESTDKSSATSLYAKLNTTESFALMLEEKLAEVEEYLKESENNNIGVKLNIGDFLKRVLALNRLPRIKGILNASNWPEERKIKNQLLAARGILQANKKLLINGENKPLATIWFEEGSIVIKTLISNPSTLISQEVPLSFCLPEEVRSETDIISIDEGLTLKYDAQKNLYCVEGKFTLNPGETKTLSVRVKDNWELDLAQLEGLRRQAEELSRPLEKTAYFAQGVSLKSDINASLDRVEMFYKGVITPEQKIKAYREAQIELKSVNEKMEKLKELVAAASGANNLLGFVGGSQAIAVWGIIVVVATGFIFLALSLRRIGGSLGKKTEEKTQEKNPPETKENSSSKFSKAKMNLILPFLIAMVIGGGVSFLALKSWEHSKAEKKNTDAGEVKGVEEEGVGGAEIVRLRDQDGKGIEVYSQPSNEAFLLEKIKDGQEVIKTAEENQWVRILIVKNLSPYEILEGWVKKEFIQEPTIEEVSPPILRVVIKETPTGWLRVRESPQGREIGKVYPGDVYEFLRQENGWYQIKFQENEGWVSSQYAELNEEVKEE